MCCWGTCTKSFTNSEAFLDHLEWHIVSPPWKCLWRGCEKQAPCDHRSNLLQHVLMHTSFRPFKCSFSECSYSSPFEWCLRRHLKTHLKKRGRRVQRPCQPIKSLFSAIRSIECVRQPPRMGLAQEEGTTSPALSVTPSTALLPQKFCNASNFIALVCLDDSENVFTFCLFLSSFAFSVIHLY